MKQCNKCKEIKPLTEYYKGKNYKSGYCAICKHCIGKKTKKYYQENKLTLKEYHKEYREKNKEKIKIYLKENRKRINEIQKKYQYRKRNEDKLHKLKGNITTRIYQAIKGKYKKKKRTIEYLGCSILFYKGFLQNKFKEGMNWNNYGDWYIDHIIPLASANTEEELIKLFHYTNTQPLWAEENIKKSDKILQSI